MKTLKFFLAAVLIGGGVYFTATQMEAQANPDCPNGCIDGTGGCYCHHYYKCYKEYDWSKIDPTN